MAAMLKISRMINCMHLPQYRSHSRMPSYTICQLVANGIIQQVKKFF